jgi:hypothetical protein
LWNRRHGSVSLPFLNLTGIPEMADYLNPNPIVMFFEPTRKQLAFVLPESYRKAGVIFEKRSDHSQLIQLVIEPNQRSRQVISTHLLSNGLWHIMLSWWAGKRQYWSEKDIVIH